MPANVQSLTSGDISREGSPSLITGLTNETPSVNTNTTLVDQFQPDVLYRGFEASPVLGTPQGLAVYQNGVRINEAFGDTVNWHLIPDIASIGSTSSAQTPSTGSTRSVAPASSR